MKKFSQSELLEQEGSLRLERLASEAGRLVSGHGWTLAVWPNRARAASWPAR